MMPLTYAPPSSALNCLPKVAYSSRHSGFRRVAGLIDVTGAPLMT